MDVVEGQVPLGAFSRSDHLSHCDHDDGDDVALYLDSPLFAYPSSCDQPIRLLSDDV